MKKILTLIGILGIFLLLFAVSSANAQDTLLNKNSYEKTIDLGNKAVSTVYSDLKAQSPKVGRALETLGKELKVGINNVWDILVKQQLVWSIAFLILTLSAITNWYLFYKNNYVKVNETNSYKTNRTRKIKEINPKYEKYSSGPDNIYLIDKEEINEEIYLPHLTTKLKYMNIIHLVICIVLSCFSFYHFNDMLTGFINPEYGAMKTIVEIASKLK